MNSCCLKFAGNSARSRLYVAIMALLPGMATALPQNGQVTSGNADLSVSGNTLGIDQHSDKVILEFDEYDLDADEIVIYRQPSVDSVALNRVVGNELSEIHGSIQANGQVFLINPNGVLFGEGAQVNVGGLMVSTRHLSDENFLHDNLRFSGDSSATISNHGNVTAEQAITLSAQQVHNSGTLHANKVHLQATNAALVQLDGSEIPILEVQPEITHDGRPEIHNDGLIRATGLQQNNGEVVLQADGDVMHSGTITASGGTVHISAERYAQTGQLHTGADDSPGDVHINTSKSIALHDGSMIDSSARRDGDAGDVNIISQGATWFTSGAQIHAKGGAHSGNGGFVEVSGHEYVNVAGEVRVGAPNGSAGLWYIDPTDVEISNFGNSDGSMTGANPYVWDFGDPAPDSAQIDINALINTLRDDGDVLLETASGGNGAGDIIVSTGFSFDGIPTGRTLSLVANRDIRFQGGVTINDINPGSEYINLDLTAGGAIDLGNSTLQLSSGRLSATAQGDIQSGNVASLLTGDLILNSGAQLTIPDAGLAASNSINLAAEDIDSASAGRLVLLDTPALRVDTAANGGTLDLVTNTNSLQIINRGSDLLRVSEVDGIELTDVQPISGSIEIYSGDASDMTLPNDIDWAGMAGSLTLVSTRDISIQGNLGALTDGTPHAVPLSFIAGNNLLMSPEASLDAGTAGIALQSQEADISLASVSGSTVQVDAAGQIIDNNGVDLNVEAETFSVSAGTGVGTSDRPFNAAASNLILSSVGDVHYASATPVEITEATVQGDLNVSASGDITMTEVNPALSGALNATINEGRLVVSNAGLNLATALTLQADAIVNTDSSAAQISVPLANLELGATNNATDILSTFEQLTLNTQGPESVTIRDTDGLEVVDLNNAGTVTLEAGDGANLTLTDSTPSWGEHLTLNAGGDVVLPDDLLISPNLSFNVSAQQISDSDNQIEVSSQELTLSLNGASDLTLDTQIEQLTLTQQGVGGLTVNNSGPLLIENLTSPGSIDITTADADLSVAANEFATSGPLRLATLNSGTLLLPATGLTTAGPLTVEADHMAAESGAAVLLEASDAQLTLRSDSGPVEIDSTLDSLALNYAGTSLVDVENTGPLNLQAVQTGGDFNVSVLGGDLTLNESPEIAGALSLTTTGNGVLTIPATGIDHADELHIDAAGVSGPENELVMSAPTIQLDWRSDTGQAQLMLTTDTFDLNYAGTSAISVINEGSLTLGNIVANGDLSLVANEGHLTFDSNPAVSGLLTTSTIGNGEIRVPTDGFNVATQWRVDADRILAGDSAEFTLQAPLADIRLRDSNSAQTWNSQFQTLAFANNGTGSLVLNNTGDLAIESLQNNASVDVNVSDGNLDLQTTPEVTGDLRLTTSATGELALPSSGLIHSGTLEINVANLTDSEGSITTDQLNITLREGTANHQITGAIGELAMDYGGSSTLSVVTSEAMTVTDLLTAGPAYVQSALSLELNNTEVGGDLTLISGENLSMLNGATSFGGTVNMTAAGDIRLNDDGITASNLVLQGASLLSLDGGPARLNGVNASLDIREQTELSLLTELDQLALQFNGERLNLVNGQDLHLMQLQAAELDQLHLDINGALRIPDSGLNSATRLNLNAADLSDTDRNVALSAQSASIHLSQVAGDNVWQVTAEQLDVSQGGSGSLTLQSDAALTLQDLNNDGYAARVDNGNLTVEVSGQLDVNGDVLARDANGDEQITGRIAMTVDSGDINIGNVSLRSERPVGTSTEDYGIALRIQDESVAERTITLGGESTVTLAAQGGDILLDPRGTAAPDDARRIVRIADNSLIRAYDDLDSPQTGQVIINGATVPASPGQEIHEGRRLVINTDDASEQTDAGNILDEVGDTVDDENNSESPTQSDADSDAQFVKVFGECNELDRNSHQRCRIENALKTFLSHWLVGGEMPPKTEIR